MEKSIINPATEDVIAQIKEASLTDVDLACQAAAAALPVWKKSSARDRQNLLWKWAELLQASTAEIALLETQNTGKTLFDSAKVEVPLAAEILKYFAGFATKILGTTQHDNTSLKYTLREPVGVCAAIVPWNFPLLMAMWKIAPALAAGNTVIIKPDERTPLSVLKLAELATQAGLPKGIFNVVTGRGESTGQALVNHPLVNKIAFTGSTEVGRIIMGNAAAGLKRVSLELGGKSPNVIFADADLKMALRGAMGGIFYNKGEVCAAGSRLLVEKTIYEQVVNTLVDNASQLTLGDPTDKGTRMGPVISREQMDRVLSYVEIGQKEGAKLRFGGKRPSHVNGGRGYFVEPTIFADVDNSMRIAQEEIFGPVLSVIPFETADDALRIANDSPYGLAAGVWTKDISKAMKFAQNVQAGTVWINAYNLYDAALPFGGVKNSGFGRDLGESALEQYLDTKSVWINL